MAFLQRKCCTRGRERLVSPEEACSRPPCAAILDPSARESRQHAALPRDPYRNTRGTPRRNLAIKICVCLLTCVNVSHLPSALPSRQSTHGGAFSTAQTMRTPVSASAIFLCHLFHIGECSPLRTFFIRERNKQTKSLRGEGVSREGRALRWRVRTL